MFRFGKNKEKAVIVSDDRNDQNNDMVRFRSASGAQGQVMLSEKNIREASELLDQDFKAVVAKIGGAMQATRHDVEQLAGALHQSLRIQEQANVAKLEIAVRNSPQVKVAELLEQGAFAYERSVAHRETHTQQTPYGPTTTVSEYAERETRGVAPGTDISIGESLIPVPAPAYAKAIQFKSAAVAFSDETTFKITPSENGASIEMHGSGFGVCTATKIEAGGGSPSVIRYGSVSIKG